MALSRTRGTVMTGMILLGFLAGCGTTTITYHSDYTMRSEPVPRQFREGMPDPIWYPEASRQLNPLPTTRYRPNLARIQAPQGNPTRAILRTINALVHAHSLAKAENQVVAADRSWVSREWNQGLWQAAPPQTPQVRLWEVRSMPASVAPFSWIVRDRYGTRVWRDSWVIASGLPGTTYTQSLRRYGPRSISWDYFVNENGHWLLYQICN